MESSTSNDETPMEVETSQQPAFFAAVPDSFPAPRAEGCHGLASKCKKPPVVDLRKLRRRAWEMERQRLFRYAVNNSARQWLYNHSSPEEVEYYLNKWCEEDKDFSRFIQKARNIMYVQSVRVVNNCPRGAPFLPHSQDQSQVTQNAVHLEENILTNDEHLEMKDMATKTGNQ